MKFIYMMRSPVERTISNFSFSKGIGEIPEGESKESILKNSIFVDRSRYMVQLEQYLRFFDRGNFLFLIFEDFLEDKEKELNKIADFLESIISVIYS